MFLAKNEGEMRKLIAAVAVLLITGGVYAGEAVTFIITAYERVATSSSEATSAAFNSQTEVVRLVCTTDCFVAVSHQFTTSATTSPAFLPGGSVEYFRVRGGNTIVFIRSTSSGVLYISVLYR